MLRDQAVIVDRRIRAYRRAVVRLITLSARFVLDIVRLSRLKWPTWRECRRYTSKASGGKRRR